MLKSYQLNTVSSQRPSSIERNLVITSLISSKNTVAVNTVSNGKNKIVTGLPSKCGKRAFHYFSNSPEITGISLRSYYSSSNHESMSPGKRQYNHKHVLPPNIDSSKSTSLNSDYLIIKQSKIALYEAYNKKKENLKNMYLSFCKNPFVKEIKARRKKIEKVSLKEAAKDKDWLTEAKPRIIKSFNYEINKSNGHEIATNQDNYFTYKYYLGSGNNSKLIKQCLSQR